MKKIDEGDIRKTYRVLDHDEETEIRIFPNNRPKSIFVTNEEEFLETCRKYNGKTNIYVGINERKPRGTRDRDVKQIGIFPVDIDAKRRGVKEEERDENGKTAATEAELERARKVAADIIQHMKQRGYREPLKMMSGNGYQLWFPIPKIKINDRNRKDIRRRMEAVQTFFKRYESEEVRIDDMVNPSRVPRIPGTLNVKGRNTSNRPHRLAKWIGNPVRREDPKLRETILKIKPRVVQRENMVVKKDTRSRGKELKFDDGDFKAPCLAGVLAGENPGHKQRLILGKVLSHYMSPKKMFEYIKKYNEWSNFDEGKTKVQVKSFYEEGKPKYALPPKQAFMRAGMWPGRHKCDVRHYSL